MQASSEFPESSLELFNKAAPAWSKLDDLMATAGLDVLTNRGGEAYRQLIKAKEFERLYCAVQIFLYGTFALIKGQSLGDQGMTDFERDRYRVRFKTANGESLVTDNLPAIYSSLEKDAYAFSSEGQARNTLLAFALCMADVERILEAIRNHNDKSD